MKRSAVLGRERGKWTGIEPEPTGEVQKLHPSAMTGGGRWLKIAGIIANKGMEAVKVRHIVSDLAGIQDSFWDGFERV